MTSREEVPRVGYLRVLLVLTGISRGVDCACAGARGRTEELPDLVVVLCDGIPDLVYLMVIRDSLST